MREKRTAVTQRTSTAASSGVEYLYHYQKYRADRLAELLRQNSIYLSDMKNFNDPWDCRPFFDTRLIDDPKEYRAHIKRFKRLYQKFNPTLSRKSRRAQTAGLISDRAFLKQCIANMHQIEEAIQDRYRIYCLTTEPTNLLMWSHYADNHTGICLEYRCQNVVFGEALKVSYFKEYPSFSLVDKNNDAALQLLLSKSKVWEYENEYRLIAQEEVAAASRETLLTLGSRLQLGSGMLKSIILGCLMQEAEKKAIVELVKSLNFPVRLRQTKRVKDKYQLVISNLEA
jgi:hypothetical protein